MHFWSFWAKYLLFLPILSHARPKPMQTRCLGGFSVMRVTKLLISPVKIRFFCPRTTKFGPKLAFVFILGQAMPAHLVPCWWVGWWLWRAGSISQDTYLLYLECFFAIRSIFCIGMRYIVRHILNPHVQRVQNMHGKGGYRVSKAELRTVEVDPYCVYCRSG